jgi:hypothetical protein
MVIHAWKNLLLSYPGVLGENITGILTYGCQLGYIGPGQFLLSTNLNSAKLAPELITLQLHADLQLRRVRHVRPTFPFISSPLGLVPKHDGGYRRIHHLSHPRGSSVNDYISPECATLTYTSVADIFKLILTAGRGATIIKRDIKDAFRHIPVAPNWQWLLGFEWHSQYYQEACLPFGLATAPLIFNLFAEALHWILQTFLGLRFLAHYLDDFMAIIPVSIAAPRYIQQVKCQYIWLTDYLGVTRNDSKDMDGTCGTLLGIEFDTLTMEARLPADKLAKARHATALALQCDSLTLLQAQSLAGLLNFCAGVVRLGRVFLPNIWDFLTNFPASAFHTHRRHITTELHDDLIWWNTLLPKYNGIHLFDPVQRNDFHLYTDASLQGLGGFYFQSSHPAVLYLPPSNTAPEAIHEPSWLQHSLSLRHQHSFSARTTPKDRRSNTHINTLELRAILYSFQRWGRFWQRQRVTVFTDSTTAFTGLRRHTLRGAANTPLRAILLLAAELDIAIQTSWLSSKSNTLADALSRHNTNVIANYCPHWQFPYQSPHFQPHSRRPSGPQAMNTHGCSTSA